MAEFEQVTTADDTFYLRTVGVGTILGRRWLFGNVVDEDGEQVMWQDRTTTVVIDPDAVTGRLPLVLDPGRGLVTKVNKKETG
jgi:hypothetical protein